MMDISYQVIELKCPRCGFIIEVQLKQVMAEEEILCLGCYADIELVDEGGSARQTQAKITQALTDLERQLRRLGR